MTLMKDRIRQALGTLVLALALVLPLGALAVTGTVNTDSLVLRASASKESKALQTLGKGDSVEIKSTTGSWYKVTYGKYSGYVMKKYVKAEKEVAEATATPAPTATAAPTTDSAMKGIESIEDIGDAPATSEPGDSGTKVKKLQMALKLLGYYDGKIDGDYGSGTEEAVKAFQKSKGMSRDGIAGPVTIELLFGEKAASSSSSSASKASTEEYTTEKLNWFKNGSATIPKGATFEIMDCKTGKKFTVKRWSGANHIDAEPLTSDDTAVMKAIYGGSWSWKRRAILVKYDGHVYAASMNGMPHGTTTISKNDFAGHFCIHFFGSKTHGTKKVDAEHQNQVAIAMKYTWK